MSSISIQYRKIVVGLNRWKMLLAKLADEGGEKGYENPLGYEPIFSQKYL